jgi:ferredoxin
MKIILEREKCIGCGSCAALCPKYWEMAEDNKSTLLGSKENSEGNFELEVKEPGCSREAADSCPVQIIHIIEKS